MKKSLIIAFLCFFVPVFGFSNPNFKKTSDYTTTVTFPAGYVVGDYIEFLQVTPAAAGAAGYYQLSIAYTRGSIAAASTHVASITHSNPALWREVGKINMNGYVNYGGNFTIDCNTQYGNSRFRIRATNTLGVNAPLPVTITVLFLNTTDAYTALNATGNDVTVNKFLPMTNQWDLYVGNTFSSDGATIAIKALENGNVGIGTATPNEKLSVNGKIRAHEIKVETTNWPDYVFKNDYKLPLLTELEQYIKLHGHLPEIPTAKEAESNGIALGEMNKLLLKKNEELTLYLIEQNKQLISDKQRIDQLEATLNDLIKKYKESNFNKKSPKN